MTRSALVPELYVSRLGDSRNFYVGALGFAVEYERPEEGFVALRLGSAQLMLEEAPSLRAATPQEFAAGQWRPAALEPPFGRGVNLELTVEDVDAVHSRVVAGGYRVLLAPYEKRYRVDAGHRLVRQCLVADPDGYLIRPSKLVSLSTTADTRNESGGGKTCLSED